MFVSQSALSDLEKRVKSCEEKHDQTDKKIGNHEKRLTELESSYRSLASTISSLDSKIQNSAKPAPVQMITTAPVASSGGDTSGLMEMIRQLQFAIQNKVEQSLFDQVKKDVDGKANKADVVLREEMTSITDRHEK
jgi:chromosome segregation ATPase